MARMGTDALPASDLTNSPRGLLAGEVIGGRYLVSHLLGEGGMAAVWAGTNQRTGKQVALKVIRSDFMATPAAQAFLHSEGLAASRVNHPNVVTVFDVIEHEGTACIVMELLDGLPLGTYIARNGQLSLRDALILLLPAMRGVAAAHAQGVVHRDLKPQNIFVCIDHDGRVVSTKVLDFGISVMLDWARERVAAMPGWVGTPAYMAPEHIEGSDRLDERVDVYGFGLLLYEALTARPPFVGEPGTEMLRRVLAEPPVPLRELRPDLPPAIVHIIETAMAKRPEQRFASLNQMVSAIEDQMMPATPPPVLGTPAVGVPVTALSYTISGPLSLAVPTHVGKEPSGQHSETQIIFGPPPKRTAEEGAPDSDVVGDWNRKLAAVGASPLPLTPEPGSPGMVPGWGLTDLPSTEVRPPGAGALLHWLSSGPVLVAAGVAVLVVIAFEIAQQRGSWGRSAAPGSAVKAEIPASPPSAPAPVAAPVDPLPPPSVVPLEPDKPGNGTSPSADQGLEEPEAAVEPALPPVRAAPGRATASSRHPARRSRAAKRAPPRAGTLSLDDF